MQELAKEFYKRENLDLANWNLDNEISRQGLVVLGCFMVDAKLSKHVLLDRLRGIEKDCPYGNFFWSKKFLGVGLEYLLQMAGNLRKCVRDFGIEGEDMNYCLDLTELARISVIKSSLSLNIRDLTKASLNCCRIKNDCPEILLYYVKVGECGKDGGSVLGGAKIVVLNDPGKHLSVSCEGERLGCAVDTGRILRVVGGQDVAARGGENGYEKFMNRLVDLVF
jgi:hypothetical protein